MLHSNLSSVRCRCEGEEDKEGTKKVRESTARNACAAHAIKCEGRRELGGEEARRRGACDPCESGVRPMVTGPLSALAPTQTIFDSLYSCTASVFCFCFIIVERGHGAYSAVISAILQFKNHPW